MTNLNEDDNLAHRTEVKNNELHVEKKDVAQKVLRKHEPVDYRREDILKKARKRAHGPVADAKRKISNEMRQHGLLEGVEQYWNTFDFGCNESYDFLEGPVGFSDQELIFEMYKKPQVSDAILEAIDVVQEDYVDPKYHTIGMFEGCFAPIGVMSRNNRVYDEDHYPYLLQNVLLENKIKTRAMLGTIGHHNKKVDDEDLAEEKVSHVITNLEVREREDGTQYLYGRAEILNTKAGRSLRTYYRHRIPLYVSSRGGGKLIDVPGQDYKRVDKTRYYLETFDVVKDPGFLDACPVANIAEEIDENINQEYNGEDEMKKEEQVISENIDVKVDEIIATTVEDAVKPDEAVAEPAHNAEQASAQEEPKKEVEDDQHEKEVGAIVEEKEETSEIIEEKCEDKKEDDKEEDKEEVVDEKCADKDEKEDKEKEEVDESISTEEQAQAIEEKCDDKKEDDDKEEDKEDDDQEEDKEEDEEDEEEVTEELKQPETSEEALHLSACLHKSLSEEELAVADYTKRANKFFEHGQETLGSMFMELADDEKEHIGKLKQMMDMLGLTNVEADTKGRMEAVKEVVEADIVAEPVEEDYKAKYEALTPVVEELLNMIKSASENLKQVIAENNESKAKINELSEKLEVAKTEIVEEQDDTDVDDDTKVDDSDEVDGPDDAMESKEETSETIEEKHEEKEDDNKEDKKDEVEDKACHESEEKAEELGEQIAESVEGMDLVDNAESKPTVAKTPVFSVFAKKEDIKPSKWYSRFSK